MTERLADISAHIHGIQQLGTVVNAMRGIAAARAQQARGQLLAVDHYAATIAAAIGRALALAPPPRPDGARKASRPAIVLFCAEQGFAGTFSERLLDDVAPDLAGAELFLVGTRGNTVARERGVAARWTSPLPAHSLGIPKLADRILEALYTRIATGEIDQLDVVFNQWQPGRGGKAERRRLFPFDLAAFAPSTESNAPLINLPAETLLKDLVADDMHAQLCTAALHAFAAENEARMEAMAAARAQIDRRLTDLRATQSRVRQEEITIEIIELAAGETASRPDPSRNEAAQSLI